MKTGIGTVVLAYSGGLDTSIIVPWLVETYGAKVVCYTGDVGQGNELDGLEARATRSGASSLVVEDLRDTFASEILWPALRAGAMYEGRYLLGTALARPVLARGQVNAARQAGADAVAHGCTGKGNDQLRFELTYRALAPDLRVVAPWREWSIRSREEALEYARARGIAVQAKVGDLYSRDRNLWHLSHEGECLEDPWCAAPPELYQLTTDPLDAPDEPREITIAFESGYPIALDGRELSPRELVELLNEIAGRHGVGRVDLVENRVVGLKSRGVYETPAGTVLMEALRDLEGITLDAAALRERRRAGEAYADLVYRGLWYSPVRKAIDQLVASLMEPVTGEVRVRLYKGTASAVARRSPRSLYQPGRSTFGAGSGYDQADAGGFIRLLGLPLEAERERSLGGEVETEAVDPAASGRVSKPTPEPVAAR